MGPLFGPGGGGGSFIKPVLYSKEAKYSFYKEKGTRFLGRSLAAFGGGARLFGHLSGRRHCSVFWEGFPFHTICLHQKKLLRRHNYGATTTRTQRNFCRWHDANHKHHPVRVFLAWPHNQHIGYPFKHGLGNAAVQTRDTSMCPCCV